MSTELRDWHRQNEKEAAANSTEPPSSFDEFPYQLTLMSDDVSPEETSTFDKFKAQVGEVVSKYPQAGIVARYSWCQNFGNGDPLLGGNWAVRLYSTGKGEGFVERRRRDGWLLGVQVAVRISTLLQP